MVFFRSSAHLGTMLAVKLGDNVTGHDNLAVAAVEGAGQVSGITQIGT
ncbi:MAG: hypothetical protein H7Y09_06910 [Chitinophagaceae bacterium]|nr:hypothetical protein [Anaerolineae bacterium]